MNIPLTTGLLGRVGVGQGRDSCPDLGKKKKWGDPKTTARRSIPDPLENEEKGMILGAIREVQPSSKEERK